MSSWGLALAQQPAAFAAPVVRCRRRRRLVSSSDTSWLAPVWQLLRTRAGAYSPAPPVPTAIACTRSIEWPIGRPRNQVARASHLACVQWSSGEIQTSVAAHFGSSVRRGSALRSLAGARVGFGFALVVSQVNAPAFWSCESAFFRLVDSLRVQQTTTTTTTRREVSRARPREAADEKATTTTTDQI